MPTTRKEKEEGLPKWREEGDVPAASHTVFNTDHGQL